MRYTVTSTLPSAQKSGPKHGRYHAVLDAAHAHPGQWVAPTELAFTDRVTAQNRASGVRKLARRRGHAYAVRVRRRDDGRYQIYARLEESP